MYLSEDAKFTIKFISAIVFVLVIIFFLLYLGTKEECKQKISAAGMEGSYGFFTGCLVKVDNRYLPLESIRFTEEKKITGSN